jgi:ribonuclease BN (tRNA processing enzyme)
VVAVPQLDVCFDIGKAPDQVISINHVLLTHGHMDHSAGFAYYLSQRNFSGMAPGTIVAPANLIAPMREILAAWGHLDGNKIPANLVGVGRAMRSRSSRTSLPGSSPSSTARARWVTVFWRSARSSSRNTWS